MLKLKVRGVVQSSTLAVHSIGLQSLGLVSETGEESAGDRSVKLELGLAPWGKQEGGILQELGLGL